MTSGLEALYGQALEYSSNALKLERQLTGRATLLASRNTKPGIEARAAFRQQHLLLNRVTPAMQTLFESLATREEKDNPLFAHVTSEFPFETLAQQMIEQLQLTPPDVDRLLQLHELKRPSLADIRFGVTAPWGVLLFVLGFLLKTVPADIFKYYHADAAYMRYELVVCLVWSVLAFVLMARGMDLWLPYLRAKREYDRLGTILGYCKLLSDTDTRNEEQAVPS